MTVLRIYDPPECDERGVPLDWEQCRRCGGRGSWWDGESFSEDAGGKLENRCEVCGGHGSLRAAALAHFRALHYRTDCDCGRPTCLICSTKIERLSSEYIPCCEGCGHPMSEGTWMRDGQVCPEPVRVNVAFIDTTNPHCAVHYSPCDEGCRHGGPGREVARGAMNPLTLADDPWAEGGVGYLTSAAVRVEASWRPVDVRTLGWPHDLRPEKLAVLCLRCYAERTK